MRRLMRSVVSTLSIAGMLAVSPWAEASWFYGTAVGGIGGNTTTDMYCGTGSVGTIKVRAGTLIDAIGIMCPADGYNPNPTMVGGSGGSPQYLSCPGSYPYLKGIQGRAGSVIDNLKAVCTHVDLNSNPPSIKQSIAGPYGNAGGSGGVYFNEHCGNGYSAAGLLVNSGSLVDRLQLTCSNRAETASDWDN